MPSEGVIMNASEAVSYTDADSRWQAVLDRDPGADGVFYYGVRTTGIYCRPTCPARPPKATNVVFFETAEAAEQASFRACLRCQPREVSAQQAAVLHAQRLLESADATPSLAELGRAVGFSPFHLQRFFRRATGLSPRQYAAAHRIRRLKTSLAAGATVTDATYDAGFGSSRAAYEAAATELGMSPGSYRKGARGTRIAYDVVDSPLGRMLVAATKMGVCAVRFGVDAALTEGLKAELPQASFVHDPDRVSAFATALREHLAGRRIRLELPLDLGATAFQERVWSALREIPYGETRTYTEVAEMIGEPGAVRAVARACALNPVALAIPCHRVIRRGGALAGYRWGIERKEALLEREKVTASRDDLRRSKTDLSRT
jgi:AraC family transcriptional regulator, regulatory protein of adaptative response / methylated-DNA-[protein]-cysteine methyltransferase